MTLEEYLNEPNSEQNLNDLLSKTNEYYLNNIQKFEYQKFFDQYKLSDTNDSKLIQKVKVRYNNNGPRIIELDYYPILLYFSGKELKFKLNPILDEFYNLIKNLKHHPELDIVQSGNLIPSNNFFEPIDVFFCTTKIFEYNLSWRR